jgi:YHS domain-containing protein
MAGGLFWALRELLGSSAPRRPDSSGEGEEMVRDPRCGVYVPVSSAMKKRIKGETVYFCSKECEEGYRNSSG